MADVSTIPNPKVNKISASKLLGKRSLEENIALNSKKITQLKNIIKAQKITVGQNISELSETPESGNALSPFQSIIESIADKVNSIQQTLLDQQEFDKGLQRKEQIKQNQQSKKSREGLLESKAFKGFAKSAKKVLAPVKNVFDQVIKFLTNIILGGIVFKMIKWWSDPANEKKVKGIIRFVGDYWPALVAGFLLFGTGLGTLVGALTKMMLMAIPVMVKAIAVMMSNPWVAGAVGLGLTAWGLGKLFGGGESRQGESTQSISESVKEGSQNQEEGDGITTGGETETSSETFTEEDILSTVTARDDSSRSKEDNLRLEKLTKEANFAQGGVVKGPGGVDKVPARLTAGEFVMSKGAVQKWGVGTLASMNAMGGGTNIPTYGGYETGGLVKLLKYQGGGQVLSKTPEISPRTDRKSEMLPIMLGIMELMIMSQKKSRIDARINESIPNQTINRSPIKPPASSSEEPKVVVLPQKTIEQGGTDDAGPIIKQIPHIRVGRGEKHVREVLGLVI